MGFYGVVNVDIVKSRSVRNRQDLQNWLLHLTDTINSKYISNLVAPMAITLGDECQAILDKPSQCYNLIHDVQQEFWRYNIEIYAGFGVGEISTALHEDVRMMDGPCFHMAREGINTAKRVAKEKSAIPCSKRNRVFFQGDKTKEALYANLWTIPSLQAIRETAAIGGIPNNEGEKREFDLCDVINTIIENNEILKSRLTSRQKQVYVDYGKYGSYRKILEAYPKEHKESIGAISQRLNNAEYFTIRRNHEVVEFLLEFYSMIRGQKY